MSGPTRTPTPTFMNVSHLVEFPLDEVHLPQTASAWLPDPSTSAAVALRRSAPKHGRALYRYTPCTVATTHASRELGPWSKAILAPCAGREKVPETISHRSLALLSCTVHLAPANTLAASFWICTLRYQLWGLLYRIAGKPCAGTSVIVQTDTACHRALSARSSLSQRPRAVSHTSVSTSDFEESYSRQCECSVSAVADLSLSNPCARMTAVPEGRSTNYKLRPSNRSRSAKVIKQTKFSQAFLFPTQCLPPLLPLLPCQPTPRSGAV